MSKVQILKAIVTGKISVTPIDKISIRRTPGDVTDVAHN